MLFIPPPGDSLLRTPRDAPVSPAPREASERPRETREQEDRRTEYSKTWVRPNGARFIQVFPYAIHQRGRDGGWEDRPELFQSGERLFSVPQTPLSTALYAAAPPLIRQACRARKP